MEKEHLIIGTSFGLQEIHKQEYRTLKSKRNFIPWVTIHDPSSPYHKDWGHYVSNFVVITSSALVSSASTVTVLCWRSKGRSTKKRKLNLLDEIIKVSYMRMYTEWPYKFELQISSFFLFFDVVFLRRLGCYYVIKRYRNFSVITPFFHGKMVHGVQTLWPTNLWEGKVPP